jgi:hypothetical protein
MANLPNWPGKINKGKGLPPDDTLKFTPNQGLSAKEKELLTASEETALEEVRKELELAPEVKEAGVEVKKEEIELPPPLPTIGVAQTGEDVGVSPASGNLPLTDDQTLFALSAPIIASIRWLAEWCLRQLKKAHIKLKKVHGEIVRIVTKE